MEAKAAIIVPVYNTEKYLLECLKSIQAQSYRNFICIVINDGSTDDSGTIAHEFAKADSRFLIFDQPNGGVSKARNYALDLFAEMNEQPKYLCFLDSDDIIEPIYLEVLVEALETYGADQASGGICYYFKNTSISHSARQGIDIIGQNDAIDHLFSKEKYSVPDFCAFLGLANKLFRYELLKDLRFRVDLKMAEDAFFYFSLLPKLHRIALVGSLVYLYRQRVSSSIHSVNLKKHIDAVNFRLTIMEMTEYEKLKKYIFENLLSYLYTVFRDAVKAQNEEFEKWAFELIFKLTHKYSYPYPEKFHKQLRRLRFGRKINHLYLRYRLWKTRLHKKAKIKRGTYYSKETIMFD